MVKFWCCGGYIFAPPFDKIAGCAPPGLSWRVFVFVVVQEGGHIRGRGVERRAVVSLAMRLCTLSVVHGLLVRSRRLRPGPDVTPLVGVASGW